MLATNVRHLAELTWRIALSITIAIALQGLNYSSAFAQEGVEEMFAQGNSHYDSSEYIEAIGAYNNVITSGFESPELYHNLGNAYFESGDLGHAVLNYLRAQRLDPGDADIRDNLAFARGFVTIQLEGHELNPVSEFLSAITGSTSLSFWGWLTTMALVVLCGLLMFRIVTQNKTLAIQSSMISMLIVLIAIGSLTTFKYRHEFAAARAVVTFPEVAVTDRPSKDANVEFTAAAGLEVVIRERSGDFALALFANKRQGWLSIAALEEL